MGVVPLVFSSGAGAEIRQAMGVAVFAGMLGVTLFGLFLTPVFYVVIGDVVARFAQRAGAARRAAWHDPSGRRPAERDTDHGRLSGATIASRIARAARGVLHRQLIVAVAAAMRAAPLSRRRPMCAGGADATRDAALRRASSRSIRAGGSSSRIRCSTSCVTAALDGNHDVRIAVARVDQARAIFDDVSARSLSDGRRPARASIDAIRRFRASRTSRVRSTTYRAGFDAFWEIDLFGRVRSAGARGGGDRRELRGDARRRARERGGGSGAQLLRAARPAAAARGGRAEPRQSARDAAPDAGAARRGLSARSRTWPAPRRAWRRSRRACRRFARALAEREHRLAVLIGVRPGDARRRSVAARLSAAGEGAGRSANRHRCCAAGPTCARRSGGWRRRPRAKAWPPRTSIRASRVTGFLGLLGGRGSLFGTARLARLGGDAGA